MVMAAGDSEELALEVMFLEMSNPIDKVKQFMKLNQNAFSFTQRSTLTKSLYHQEAMEASVEASGADLGAALELSLLLLD